MFLEPMLTGVPAEAKSSIAEFLGPKITTRLSFYSKAVDSLEDHFVDISKYLDKLQIVV